MIRWSLVNLSEILVHGRWILINGRGVHFNKWKEEYFDNRLACNKPGIDFAKV